MSYSDVTVDVSASVVEITARGGTRRQRGAAIAAQVREFARGCDPERLQRVSVSYSETYGFQTATYARYTRG